MGNNESFEHNSLAFFIKLGKMKLITIAEQVLINRLIMMLRSNGVNFRTAESIKLKIINNRKFQKWNIITHRNIIKLQKN